MIKLNPTDKTPAVTFDVDNGVLSIEGKSFMESSYEFYEPVLKTIKEYIRQPKLQTEINLKFEYFNTSSSKSILEILREFEKISNRSEVTVNWHYEKGDDDMLEVGQDYQTIVTLPFKMIEV